MEVKWTERYSFDDYPDERNRWARVGYAGLFNKDGTPKFDKKLDTWKYFEIAWISQVSFIHSETKQMTKTYVVSYRFPNYGKLSFSDIDDAKKEVENQLKIFLEIMNK
jgi:hypothetical protein